VGANPSLLTAQWKDRCTEHRVTIGRNSTIKADIQAREVAVMGSVKGNIHCSDLVDLRGKQYSGRDRHAADPYRRRRRPER